MRPEASASGHEAVIPDKTEEIERKDRDRETELLGAF
jgi:hypothetical protein